MADNKWFTLVIVAADIIHTLDSLKLNYPKMSDAKRKNSPKQNERCWRVTDPD